MIRTLITQLLIFAISFHPTIAVAALTDFDRQEITFENILAPWNAGFESGKAQWTASGGTFAAVTSGSNLLTGKGSATWDSGSASQTLISKAVTVPNGLKGRNCEASIVVMVPSGAATHTLSVYDGTNTLVSSSITSSTTPTKNTVNFPCPSSGTIQLRLTSVASDEPLITLDSAYMGEARNIGQVNNFTNWTSYTPTLTNGGTTSTNVGWWRRVGDTMEIQAVAIFTGAGAAGSFTVGLPSGYTMDTTSKSTTSAHFGTCIWYDQSTPVERTGWCGTSNSTSLWVVPDGNSSILQGNSLASGDYIRVQARVPIVGWQAEQAFRPDTVAWRVDANISGANPSLGTSSVASYTEITDGSLTLTNNSGRNVVTAQITCSSTNSPSGTTCSAGSESLGVAFPIPRAEDVEACVDFAHYIDVGSAAATGGIYTTFQIVETPTNAQTISQEGKSRPMSGNEVASSNGRQIVSHPVRLCGTFTFTSSGTKALRLMYEQNVSGTVSSSVIYGDASAAVGQRDIHWTVRPLGTLFGAPLLVGSVTNSSTGLTRVETASINCDASSAINLQNGSWVSSVGNISSGQCAVTIAAGLFSSAPVCMASWTSSGGTVVYAAATSATNVNVGAVTLAGAASTGFDANIQCTGPR